MKFINENKLYASDVHISKFHFVFNLTNLIVKVRKLNVHRNR